MTAIDYLLQAQIEDEREVFNDRMAEALAEVQSCHIALGEANARIIEQGEEIVRLRETIAGLRQDIERMR